MISSKRASELAALRWIKHSDVLPPPQKIDIAKQKARAAGLTKYIGTKCKRGHDGLRYTKGGQCVLCVAIRGER